MDALKRVDAEMSSQRLVLLGVASSAAAHRKKLCLLNASNSEVVAAVKALPGDAALSKALLSVLQGVSLLFAGNRASRGTREGSLPSVRWMRSSISGWGISAKS